MSALPATATPLLRPRSRSSRLMARQSGASNGVLMPKISNGAHNGCRFHFAGKCSTGPSAIRKRRNTGETEVASDQALVRETACAIVDKLNSGEVTPLDLLDVLESRIAEIDGKVNALPTLCFDRARSRAKTLMKKPVGDRGLLAGLPVPIKDLFNVEGVKNTQGSPIFKDTISASSDIVVEH